MEYETKTVREFLKNNSEIVIEKTKWSFLELCKVLLYLLLLKQPNIAQNIGKNNLKKYATNMKKLLQYCASVSTWRNDIDEISNLIGE